MWQNQDPCRTASGQAKDRALLGQDQNSAGHDRIMHWLRSGRPSFKKINDNIVSEHQNVPTSVDEALRSVCRNIHNASPIPLPPALS